MKLSSPKFENKELIPQKYTCDGRDINPPLRIKEIPEDTQSLVLIVDDPDAPVGTWTHWVLYDIEPKNEIKENDMPGKQGLNDFDKKNYGGPCPPSGEHRYFFRLYAIDKKIEENDLTRDELESKMKDHIIDKAELIGLYKRG